MLTLINRRINQMNLVTLIIKKICREALKESWKTMTVTITNQRKKLRWMKKEKKIRESNAKNLRKSLKKNELKLRILFKSIKDNLFVKKKLWCLKIMICRDIRRRKCLRRQEMSSIRFNLLLGLLNWVISPRWPVDWINCKWISNLKESKKHYLS